MMRKRDGSRTSPRGSWRRADGIWARIAAGVVIAGIAGAGMATAQSPGTDSGTASAGYEVAVRATGFQFPEGPVATADGTVFLVNYNGTEINVVHPDGTVGVLADVGVTNNGMVRDREGNFYLASVGGRAILEYTATGDLKTLVTVVDGDSLHGPNDLAWGPGGRLYFTDPQRAGRRGDPIGRVFYLDPDGTAHAFVTGIQFPNGLAFNRDRTCLYVNQTDDNRIISFPVNPDGTRGGDMTVVYAFPDGQRPDGLKLDVDGNLWVAVYNLGEFWCISPQGDKLDSFKVPSANVTNIVFGGPDNRTAYITGHSDRMGLESWVFSVRMPVAGAPPFPW